MSHWVIVGAGSAGCVLANRLSADGSRRVTLLDDGPGLDPGQVPASISGSSFFAAMAEPGRLHHDLLATRAPGIEPTVYQRGRGVGGSSAVNAMVALRGRDELYRSWGWHDIDAAWQRVLIPTAEAAAHEVGAVDRALRSHPRGKAAQLTRSGSERVTSAQAYLWPALANDNLTVRPNAEVRRVLFDDRKATGVELADATTIDADQVIVAAGAIHSPVILLRSGVDTPGVGLGLQDHPSAVFTLQLRDGVDQDTSLLPIASTLHATVGEHLLQLLPMSHLGADPDLVGLGALMAALMNPVSRSGSVGIDSNGAPVIDFALLADDRDLHGLAAAANLALEVLSTKPFTEIVHTVYIDDQGTTIDALDDQAAMHSWLRSSCGDYVHASSTCAMGTVVDQQGQVHGYQGLFVCDASIFPSVPDANTHFPTTMLAERLAYLLGQ